MNIKIECGCGTRFSFDVEPQNGAMPFAVNCPSCNADGTEAANKIIAESQVAKPRLRVHVEPEAAAAATPKQTAYFEPPAESRAMQKLRAETKEDQKKFWMAGGVVLLILAFLGGWMWLSMVASRPHLAYAIKVPAETEMHIRFLGPDKALMVSAQSAVLRDLKANKEIWSTALDGAATADDQIFLDKDNLWICLGNCVKCLSQTSGEVKQTITIPGEFSSFTQEKDNILVVSAKDETTRTVTRIDLATGEAKSEEIVVPRKEKHRMPDELPPNVEPTAGVLLSQALEEQKFNKPLDAISSEFFSAGDNLVELRVRLLEPKVTWIKTIKPKGPTHINGQLTASSNVKDVAEEVFNDIKRDQTGGVRSVDESRYEVRLRRWTGEKPVEWKGEVSGVPSFFSLPTVDLLVAGKLLSVFNKQNEKLFDSQLGNTIGAGFVEEFGHRFAPAVEGPGTLYFFDQGVLTAFELPAGTVRWRLTSIGISQIQFDEKGMLYVSSTSASPEDIQYSDQIKMEGPAPILMKVDPKSGKILWQIAKHGRQFFLSGKYVYSTSADVGGVAMANALGEALGSPGPSLRYFHLYRLNPENGDVMWDFYREQVPEEAAFAGNHFLLRFGDQIQFLKFLPF